MTQTSYTIVLFSVITLFFFDKRDTRISVVLWYRHGYVMVHVFFLINLLNVQRLLLNIVRLAAWDVDKVLHVFGRVGVLTDDS